MRKRLNQYIERIWWQNDLPPLAFRLCSKCYARISAYHLQQRGKQQQATATLPLISIGNITVGGSGKTPFVAWLVGMLQQHGMSPVILCRGDGGKSNQPLWVDAHSATGDVGDEAVLLYHLTGCPVLAARDRLSACQIITASGRGNIIILDDGFQYRHVKRQCDIVMVPAEGVGNGWMIPAGPLREPTVALDRADIVVRSSHQLQTNNPPSISGQHEWLWSAIPDILVDWMHVTGTRKPSPSIPVQAITSIARPDRFFHNLEKMGFVINKRYVSPDHYDYSALDIKKLAALPCPVTTAKDAVKLLANWPKHCPLWVLRQKVVADEKLLVRILTVLDVATEN